MVGAYVGDRGEMNRDAGEIQESTYWCANNGSSKWHDLDRCLSQCLASKCEEPKGCDGSELHHVDGAGIVLVQVCIV